MPAGQPSRERLPELRLWVIQHGRSLTDHRHLVGMGLEPPAHVLFRSPAAFCREIGAGGPLELAGTGAILTIGTLATAMTDLRRWSLKSRADAETTTREPENLTASAITYSGSLQRRRVVGDTGLEPVTSSV